MQTLQNKVRWTGQHDTTSLEGLLEEFFIFIKIHGSQSYTVTSNGYMSPEYAMKGHFSVKSDVYSFGVLVLEIITGKRNSSLDEDGIARNLVTYVWRLWREGSPSELVDLSIGENYDSNEATRCIHIALLCVQQDPADRPTLASIILMLTSNTITLPVPQQPGFFFQSRLDQVKTL